MAVKTVLTQLDIQYITIGLCKVELVTALTDTQQKDLAEALKYYELELIDTRLVDNKKSIMVERIKTLIIELLQSSDSDRRIKLSEWLSDSLHYNYTYLANIFSEMEGNTIEKFYIINRIELAKELMVYETLSLKEIAYRLNYSSVAHLCFQFKKITGQTPSTFKKLSELSEISEYMWKL